MISSATRTPVARALSGLLMMLLATTLATGAHAATVSWNVDADGDWNVGSNWSGGVVPTLSDTVIIDRGAGLYTITVPSGTHEAYSIFSNENVVFDAGTITVSTTIQVNAVFSLEGTTIVGATIQPGSGGEGVVALSGTLDGVIMNADMDMSEPVNLSITIKNGLTLNGSALMGDEGTRYGRFLVSGAQTIDGTGEIILGSASATNGISQTSGGDLIIESGLTIHGARGTIGTGSYGVVLKAPVTAEVSGEQIYLLGDSLIIQAKVSSINGAVLRLGQNWINQDTVEVATGGVLNLDGVWENQGTILVTDAATTLGGTFTTAGYGDFQRSGGTVKIDGTLDNTGDSLVLDANTGSWELKSGGTILGGMVETGLAGSELTYSAGTLDGVTMNADMDMSEPVNMSVTLKNGLTLNGSALMGDEGTRYGRFVVSGAQTIDGTGEIILGSASTTSGIAQTSGGDLVVESGLTIHGGSGTIGTGSYNLVMRAPVTAEIPGEQIYVLGDSLTLLAPATAVSGGNLRLGGVASIEAKASVSGGGTLWLSGAWVNQDTLQTGTGCGLNLDGTWENQGTILIADTDATLGGNFTTAGYGDFQRSGGTVKIDGTLDNTGDSLVLDANTGSWELKSGGTILGGMVEPGLAGSELTYTGGTLDGVTMNADMDMSEPVNLSITLKNGLTLNGTVLMGDEGTRYGRFVINGAQTIDGTGEIILGSASTTSGITQTSGGDLVVESGLTIHGGSGTIGTGSYNLVMRAPVTAEIPGEQIYVLGDSLTLLAPATAVSGGNLRLGGVASIEAKASVSGGGTLWLSGAWVNQDTLQTGTGCGLNLDGTWENQGAILIADTDATLGGNFTTAGYGDFQRSGGTVKIDGTLDNTGDSLVLDATTGSWELKSGGTILGGTVEPGLAGSELTYSAGTLDGVTMNADMDMSEPVNVSITLKNGLTLNGTVLMGDDGTRYGRFVINGAQTIDGTGEIVLGRASTTSGITPTSGGDLVVESGITIHGARGSLGSSSYAIVNRGTVRADSAGYQIRLYANTWTNEGTAHAAGGDLDNRAPILNTGIVQVDSLSEMLGSGSLTQDSGNTHVDGTLDHTTVTINGGTLSGDGLIDGELSVSAGAVTPGSSAGTLTGTGGYTQSDGRYEVEIAGASLSDYDRLEFAGTAAVAGSLGVGFLDSFLPAIGDTFTVVQGSSLSGLYSPMDLPYMVPSQRWLAETPGDSYQLIVELNEPPAAVCQDTLLIAGLDCQATVSAADLDGGTSDPEGHPFTLELAPPGPYDIGVNLVNFIATDSLGHADSCLTTITVFNSAPVAASKDTSIVVQPPMCTLTLDASDLDDGTFDAEGQAFSLVLDPPGPYPVGVTNVLFIATDDCGAADTSQSIVTVINNAPIAACKDTTLIAQPPDWSADIVAADLDEGTVDPDGHAFALTLVPAGPYPEGSNQVLFIATDGCGAADTCQTTINVINNAPIAACKDTSLIAVSGTCDATVTPADLDDGSFDPDGHPITLSLVPPGPYPIGDTPVLFIATDDCAASDTCNAIVTVINNAPIAACKDTTLISQPPDWSADVTAADLDAGTTEPDGHNFTLALAPPGPYAEGVNNVLFIATDECGAADTCMTTITVQNNAPIAACKDTTVVADLSCEGVVTPADLDDGTVDPDGHDFTLALDPAGPFPIGATPVLFIATDDCGAADTCMATVTVINNAPIAACLDTTLVGQGPGWEADIDPVALDGGTTDPDGHNFTLALAPPGPYPLGENAVLFIATDQCGAADTCNTTITVINNPPVAASRDTTLIADLSCEGNVAAAGLDDGTTDPDGHSFTLALDPAGPYPVGVHNVNFIATDECGAADTSLSVVTVINNAPIAACRDTSLTAQAPDWTADIAAAALDAGTTDPDGHSFTLALEPVGPYPLGDNEVLFIATDQCGAADTCMTTISVINLPPVAVAVSDTTIVTDGLSCTGTIEAADLDRGTTDPEGQDITLALEPAPPYALGSHAVLFIATDDCGASDTTQTNITVINNAPTAVAVEQLIVLADSLTCIATVDPAAFDDGSSDPDGQTLTFTTDPEGPFLPGLTLVTLIVSDGCETDTTHTELIVQCNQVAIGQANIPLQFAVDSAVPNPFHGSMRIQLALPEARHVRAQVFNVAGKRVADLVNRRMEAGRWDISWDGRANDGSSTGAGVYLFRIQAGDDIVTRKAIRVR